MQLSLKTGKYFSSEIMYFSDKLLIITANIFFGCYLMSNISILEIFLLNILERLLFENVEKFHQWEKAIQGKCVKMREWGDGLAGKGLAVED